MVWYKGSPNSSVGNFASLEALGEAENSCGFANNTLTSL